MIFEEGQMLEGVYLVVSGAVSLRLAHKNQTAEIAAVGPGEYLGEAGMHGAHTAEMHAVATEDTEVLAYTPDAIQVDVPGQSDARTRNRSGARRPAQGAAVGTRGPAAPMRGARRAPSTDSGCPEAGRGVK